MSNTVLIILVALINAVGVAVWKSVDWYIKYKVSLRHKGLSKEDRIKNSLQVNKILYCLGKQFQADTVFLARFHNGGSFIGGYDMDKFSVTHYMPVKERKGKANFQVALYKDILLTLISDTAYRLFFDGESSLSFAKHHTDIVFKNMFDSEDAKTIIFETIKNDKQEPVAFIGIIYSTEGKCVLDSEERVYFLNNTSGLLQLLQQK